MRILFLISLLPITFFLSGCTVVKPSCAIKPPSNCDLVTDDYCSQADPTVAGGSVEGQLMASAKSIERSLAVLAGAEEAENAPILNTGPLVTPEGGMGGTIDIDWTGPVGP